RRGPISGLLVRNRHTLHHGAVRVQPGNETTDNASCFRKFTLRGDLWRRCPDTRFRRALVEMILVKARWRMRAIGRYSNSNCRLKVHALKLTKHVGVQHPPAEERKEMA